MRLNEDDLNKFKDFAAENKLNQQQAFNMLLSLAEIEKVKDILGDRAKEIDAFRDTINKLLNFYINSLEINQTTESRIREELSQEIKSKDEVIKDLQIKYAGSNAEAKEYYNNYINILETKKDFEEKLNRSYKEITDKNNQIEISNRNNNNLQEQLNEFKQYKENYKLLESEISKLKTDISTLQNDNSNLYNDNQLLNNKVKSDAEMISFYKTELEKSFNSIQEYKADIKALENKYIKEIEHIKIDNIHSLESQMKALVEQHNNKLEMEIAKKDLEINRLNNTAKQKKNKIKE